MKVVNKEIHKFEDISDKINKAVGLLVDPIKGTMSPKGANVIFTDENGTIHHTNDGFTIAKNINVSDTIDNAIIDIVKEASIKTNSEAGDGTSTTALLSQILIKEGLQKVSEGWNKMTLTREMKKAGEKIISRLEKQRRDAKGEKDLEYIATIAANNDKNIAKDVVKVVDSVGKRGLVFIEPNPKLTTEIKIDSGFVAKSGIFSPELRTSQDVKVVYNNVPVLITDKKLYHHEEAATIIKTALDAGYDDIVVVAKDFIGESINTFVANHTNEILNILLVKEPAGTSEFLEDLAVYLGTEVIRDKKGMLVNKITPKSFGRAEKVYSDNVKTIFSPKDKSKTNPNLTMRINTLQKMHDDEPENKEVEERLASLTNGMVTIKVGGSTPIEVNERIYRYEDAVNATRAALDSGYLVGGGIALNNCYNEKDYNKELDTMFLRFCTATVRQIAINCGKHPETIIKEVGGLTGYNANTDKMENLLESGIIDPYKVTEMAVRNSISVASAIISSNYLIVNKEEEDGKK